MKTSDVSEEPSELTIDLSKRGLRKIERAVSDDKQANVLILNENEIQRLENLDSYVHLKKLFINNNQLVRMFGVSHLVNLQILELCNNSLVTIEGLKDLKLLKELNLSKNKIKTIEHINNNLDLVKLDFSENHIASITDISFLKHLKELYLHGNKITHLKQCEKNLPNSIMVLSLHSNMLYDLNEVSHLVSFTSLKEFSIADNPCVKCFEGQNEFNYRPFVKNWCPNLVTLDDDPLDDIECLKAEWLYSQGRGRSFKPGEQAALTEYLSSVCPIKETNDGTENLKKLKLILSKAQQHQKQLREQHSSGNLVYRDTLKSSGIKKNFRIPEKMSNSFHDFPVKNQKMSTDLMTRSLDSSMVKDSQPSKGTKLGDFHSTTPLQTSSTFIPIPDSLISPDVYHSTSFDPRQQKVPSFSIRSSPCSTPESMRKLRTNLEHSQSDNSHKKKEGFKNKFSSNRSKISTLVNSSPSKKQTDHKYYSEGELKRTLKETSEEEDSEALPKKLSSTKQRSTLKRLTKKRWDLRKDQNQVKCSCNGEEISESKDKNETFRNAAICIQRQWRGYRARNLNGNVIEAYKDIQMNRMQEYIAIVLKEMEATRAALEGNRKLQVLQIQAINALWKKIMTIQQHETSNENKLTERDLIQTCSKLNKQIEELQIMMKTIQNSSFSNQMTPIATQTDIVAVHSSTGDKKSFLLHKSCNTSWCSEAESKICDFVEDSNSTQKDIEEIIISEELTVKQLNSNDDPLKENVFLTSNSLTEKEVEFVKESLTKPLVKLESSTDILDGNPEKKELKKEPMIELVNTDECPVGGRF